MTGTHPYLIAGMICLAALRAEGAIEDAATQCAGDHLDPDILAAILVGAWATSRGVTLGTAGRFAIAHMVAIEIRDHLTLWQLLGPAGPRERGAE